MVRDLYSGELLEVSIYIAYGIINGYSVDNSSSKYKFDASEVDVSFVKKFIIGDRINLKILSFLTDEEKKFVNVNDIYATTINGKDYYHLKELEDGDFIGIDEFGGIYKVVHDPFEISLVRRGELLEIVKGGTV